MMNETVTFPPRNGYAATFPVNSGRTWSNGHATFAIVDSGHVGHSRYAIVGHGMVRFARSIEVAHEAARCMAQRV